MKLAVIGMFAAASATAMRIPECSDPVYVASAADAIVHGTVVKVQPREDKGGMIHTYVMVKVDQALKGKKVKILTIKRPGGTIKKGGKPVTVEDGDGSWTVKTGDAGWLHLTHDGKFYGLVCGQGLTQELPKP